MFCLDYAGFLTVICLALLCRTPVISDPGADYPDYLASYNDSEDPDTDLDQVTNDWTSSRPQTARDDTHKVDQDPGEIIPIHTDDEPTDDDDIYVHPEYTEEDPNVTEDDEEEEGAVLNWIQNSVGAGIFDDVSNNEAMLSRIPDDHHLVYPVQIRKNEVLGLDTHDRTRTKPGIHFYHTTLLFRMDGKKYKLKLSLNKDLVSREMKQKRNIDAKTQIIEEGALENCFYQGEVRKSPGSKVIVNTCNGISGIILLDNTTYAIRPLKPLVSTNETRWPHVMYELPDFEQVHRSANNRGMWISFRELHIGEYMRRRKIMAAMKNEFDVVAATKRLQLGLVADHDVVMRVNGSLSSILIYFGQLANILDTILQGVNIRVTLKYVELWNYENLAAVDRNARVTLHNMFTYRQEALSFLEVDVVHLISGLMFDDNELGMAIPDSVCTQRALAVSYDASDIDMLRTANGILHMLGHQFGLRDQPIESCPCPYAGGCIMSVTANASIPHHAMYFSPCAQTALREALLGGLGTCLLETPPQFLSYSQRQEVFTQTCGNGHLERGEECDCLSKQECRLQDPCCNPKTCLLQPWATCRHGDCCDNCTVVPANYICRLAVSQCDVPEFCDGTSGYCPHNAVIQNGWPCKNGEGFCYEGLCQTYSEQCHTIWGDGAMPADSKCYETFNTAGRFNGHCGTNKSSNDYIKCNKRDVTCGLLHCEGGTIEPSLGKDNVFSTTTVNSAGVNYECKIISSHHIEHFPDYGMVQDGTKCDNNSICLGARCVNLDLITSGVCKLGDNNLVCSGHGVCTSDLTCFCNISYTGDDCSEYKPQTTLLLPRLVTSIVSQLERNTLMPSVSAPNITSTMIATTTESVIITKAERSVSTIWLIIVLSSVAGGALLILGCCMMCYRRKSTVTFKKRRRKKKKNPSIFGSLTSFSSGNSKSSRSKEDSGDEVTNRIISFGNMPSYRADKIKKVMRKNAGENSEESEHNASNRSSAEVKVVHTLPLAKAPERGILKKYPRSTDDLQCTSDTESHRSSRRAPGISMEMEVMRSSQRHHPGAASCGEAELMLSHNYEEINNVECGDDDECGSSCSCEADDDEDDDDKKSDGGLTDELCDCCSDNKDQQTQTDLDSAGSPELPRELSSDSLEGAKSKIIKLKNINELLKQIDEQFNNVLRQTTEGDTSPTGSEEIRGSETEADRHFPRNSFYKQSDIEEGYSPPHRSPILSPNPSTQRSSTRYSSNTGSGSPETPFSPGVISPIQPVSPVQSTVPLASPSVFMGAVPSHYRDPLRGPRHTTSTPKSTPTKVTTSPCSHPRDQAASPPHAFAKTGGERSEKCAVEGGKRLQHDTPGQTGPRKNRNTVLKVNSPYSESPTERVSPMHRTVPTRKGSPPRRGSPVREPCGDRSSPRMPITIPKCPARHAPELVHSPGRRYSPEHGTQQPVSSGSKYSPRFTRSDSLSSSPKNANNSSNNDGSHKVEPLVTAVPYRGAKSGSPTPQPRMKPGQSVSGDSPTAQPQSKTDLSRGGSPLSDTRNHSTGSDNGSAASKKRNPSASGGTPSVVADDRESSPSPGSTHGGDKGRRLDKGNKSTHSPKSSASFLSKLTQPLFENNPFKRRGSHSNDGNSVSEGYYSDHVEADDAVVVRDIGGKKPVDLPFMPNPNGSYTRAPGSPGSPEDINV